MSAPPLARELAIVLGASASWAILLAAAACLIAIVKRCVGGAHAWRARLTLAGLVVLYLSLWATTAQFGGAQVHRVVLAAVRDSAALARPPIRPPMLTTRQQMRQQDSAVTIPWYYADAVVAGPCLVRVDRGYMAGFLWGSGGRDWYLWFFGLRIRLVQTDWWVS